ncbi:hypothetical protein TNCV_1861041 [Trichonephila clavipes]|nr:hypothetical protein TNCV_1861041 [Trichonephila clavipes]
MVTLAEQRNLHGADVAPFIHRKATKKLSNPHDAAQQSRQIPWRSAVKPSNPSDATLNPSNPSDATLKPSNPSDATLKPSNPSDATLKPSNPYDVTFKPSNTK